MGKAKTRIKNNETGILVTPENPQSLQNEINNLLKNSLLQKQLSNNAFEFIIEHYAWETLLPKYVNFYENLIK